MVNFWRGLSRRDKWGWAVAMAIILVFYLCVVGMCGLMWWINGAKLEGHGLSATGIVTASNTSGSRGHWVRYEWRVDGKKFEGQDGCGRAVYYEGDPIAIRYLPEHPSVAHFDWQKLRLRGMLIVLIGIPFGSLLPLFLWLGERQKQRASRLPVETE